MITTTQVFVNENKHDLSMLIDRNLRLVIAAWFLRGMKNVVNDCLFFLTNVE